MEIVVKSRHCTPSEVFREVAQEKLSRLDRFNHPIARIDVELSREHAPRQSATCEKVELTVSGKGPVVRGEAQAGDPVSALDLAISKVEARLRKLTGRRKAAHAHGNHPVDTVRHGLAPAAPDLLGVPGSTPDPGIDGAASRAATALLDPADPVTDPQPGPATRVDSDGPFVVREKVHTAEPMTRDQALERMELVGHDFFLYVCSSTGMPSVVYRRHAYDYGVLHLELSS